MKLLKNKTLNRLDFKNGMKRNSFPLQIMLTLGSNTHLFHLLRDPLCPPHLLSSQVHITTEYSSAVKSRRVLPVRVSFCITNFNTNYKI